MPPGSSDAAVETKSEKKRRSRDRAKVKSADGRRWSTLDQARPFNNNRCSCILMTPLKCLSSSPQDFTPPKKGEASFSGLPYAKQWMARKDIDRFISNVNDNASMLKESAPPSKSVHGSPTRQPYATSQDTHRSAKSARSAASTGVEVLQEGVHVPADSEERRLDARCVLNLPGYRENKVRTLLFKNQELEQALKDEKANVRRLVRANDALEKQVLQLNASQNLPRSAPAVSNHISNQNLWSEKKLEESSGSEAQIIDLESKVTRMNREISDLYQELQRCLADQKRLEKEASDAEKKRDAAEKRLEERERGFEIKLQSLKSGEAGSDGHEYYSATSDSAESTPRGWNGDQRGHAQTDIVIPKPPAEPPKASPRPRMSPRNHRQLSPSDLTGAAGQDSNSHLPSSGINSGADVSETSFIASTPSPASARRGAFQGGVCPLGLSICIGAGVCVCGEWEARLERAEKQVADEQQRCVELGEQLNNQLTREIALESTLASLRERCFDLEHVSEMLAKEAELGASLLEKKFDDASSSCSSLERVVEMLCATVQNVQESSVLQRHAVSRRLSQRETEIHERAVELAELEHQIVQLKQELSGVEESKEELLKEKSSLAGQLEQLQESLSAAQRSSRDLATSYGEAEEKLALIQRDLQDSKIQADDQLAASNEHRMQLEAALRHEKEQVAQSHEMRDKAANELEQERQEWCRLEESLQARIKAAEVSKQELREALHEETSLSCSLRDKLGLKSEQVPALNQEMTALKAELAEAHEALARHEGAREQIEREACVVREEAKKASHQYHKKVKGLEQANMTLVDSLREAKNLLAGLCTLF